MLKGIKWTSALLAAICVICGILLLFNPDGMARSICRVIGIVALISGALKLFEYYTDGDPATPSKQQLTRGLFEIIAALFLLFMTNTVLALINLAVGLAIIAYCIFSVQSALDKMKLGKSNWLLSLAGSALGILLGVIMAFGGISAANTVIRLAGIALLVYGGKQLFGIYLVFGGKK